MNLLLAAIEQFARLVSEWAYRRREVYVEPRPIDVLVEESWGPRPVRRIRLVRADAPERPTPSHD